MTFSFVEVLLLLGTIAFVFLAVALARAGQKLGRAVEEFQTTARLINEIEPQVRRVLETLEQNLQELQTVTRKSQTVASDVAAISHESRRVALDLIHDVEELQLPERYRAAVAGARAGLAVLKSVGRNRA